MELGSFRFSSCPEHAVSKKSLEASARDSRTFEHCRILECDEASLRSVLIIPWQISFDIHPGALASSSVASTWFLAFFLQSRI